MLHNSSDYFLRGVYFINHYNNYVKHRIYYLYYAFRETGAEILEFLSKVKKQSWDMNVYFLTKAIALYSFLMPFV